MGAGPADPKIGLLSTMGNLFRHGFIRAFNPTAEGSVHAANVLPDGPVVAFAAKMIGTRPGEPLFWRCHPAFGPGDEAVWRWMNVAPDTNVSSDSLRGDRCGLVRFRV